MNRQLKRNPDGSVKSRGIEWTDYTSNPIGGCFHACQWKMPDGSLANCYAEDVAGHFSNAYPHGFEHHYWKPSEFKQWKQLKPEDKVFVGSMADVFGHWVPAEQIRETLDHIREFPAVTFQMLTKNPKRVFEFRSLIPSNCWIGASTPPDFMWNRALTQEQKERLLQTTLNTLAMVKQHGITTWMSAEPLSWDISRELSMHVQSDTSDLNKTVLCLDWIVIGAASNGKKYYPPLEQDVRHLLMVCDKWNVPVFFKGNMKSLPWARDNWREDLPT